MISPIPIRRRQRRHKAKVPAAAPPAGRPLTLIDAQYDPGASTVGLVFDRAIDIGAFNATLVTAVDGEVQGYTLAGAAGVTLVDPVTVRVTLVRGEPFAPFEAVMAAPADTGVVAADDGGTWGGVTGYPLFTDAQGIRAVPRRGHGHVAA